MKIKTYLRTFKIRVKDKLKSSLLLYSQPEWVLWSYFIQNLNWKNQSNYGSYGKHALKPVLSLDLSDRVLVK
jgi:hypothetical protein